QVHNLVGFELSTGPTTTGTLKVPVSRIVRCPVVISRTIEIDFVNFGIRKNQLRLLEFLELQGGFQMVFTSTKDGSSSIVEDTKLIRVTSREHPGLRVSATNITPAMNL